MFVLDRLPYAKDQARIEDQQTAARLDRELEAGYRTLGYEIKRIAVMSVQDRLKLILQEIEKQ